MIKCLSSFVRNQTLCQLNPLAEARLVASGFLRRSFGSYFLKPYSFILTPTIRLSFNFLS
jgi:hypothetical protein